MDEKKKLPRPEVVKILGVSRAASIAAVFSGLLIVVGLIESVYFLGLSLMDLTIMAAVLFVFYVVLLMFLLKPRVIKIIKRIPGKKPASQQNTRKPAIEDIKAEVSGTQTQRPVVVNINNQTTPKKRGRKSSKKRK
jgi:hypothetical protein